MSAHRRFLPLVIAFVVAILLPETGSSQTARNVLVVVNRNSRVSEEIGEHYAQKRQIPPNQILRVSLPAEDEVDRLVYVNQLERPILEWLTETNSQDRILYIVLTKGIPLRIAGVTGVAGTVSSVDSDLTLLYRKATGVPIALNGALRNPYYLAEAAISTARPFSHRTQDIYLVTRLDGYTVADVKGLIDRGSVSSRPSGSVLLRTRGDRGAEQGDGWLSAAADRLGNTAGSEKSALLWRSVRGVPDSPLIGYYSWGSNDPFLAGEPEPSVSFVPGAIGGLFVSSDARTLQPPPDSWRPGVQFAGTPQSLIGHLIRNGITGVAGHVAEPFLTNAVRPDILFPAYLRGLNLAEAFYLAMPSVSWQNVIIGDPLCAPFRQAELPPEELDPPVDSITELPRFLSEKRVALFVKAGVDPEGARFFIKAERRLARKDRDGARKALEESIRLSPRFADSQLTLAMILDSDGDAAGAIARYRQVLEVAPNNALALNNLAYGLAVGQKNPKEALPLARRALSVAPNSPDIADTLGWIHHLLGDNMSAEPLLIRAVGLAPNSIEPLVHLAIVLEANGKRADAKTVVERAVKLNPGIKTRADVRPLLERLDVR